LILLGASSLLAQDPPSRQLELHSEVFGNTRSLRIALPEGYDDPANRQLRYPVFYFLDGRPAFGPWGAPDAARRLAASGDIPPMIVVGIDNGGLTSSTVNAVRDRASEYIPYADPTWTDEDAPIPHGDRFPRFLVDEVMPRVNAEFRTLTGPEHTGLAGASYGAAAALYTVLTRPGLVGHLLLESPSLQLGEGRLFEDARLSTQWPAAIYIGVGTEEGETPEIHEQIVAWARRLRDIVASRAPDTRLKLVVQPGGIHWYTSWGERLPVALRFLLREAGER
jgi:enterochelin esterase-like enzyme